MTVQCRQSAAQPIAQQMIASKVDETTTTTKTTKKINIMVLVTGQANIIGATIIDTFTATTIDLVDTADKPFSAPLQRQM